MEGQSNFQSYLCISHRHKGIPYGGDGILREDGDANYGFKSLKGALHLIDEVPELKSDSALRELALAVNQPSTGLLSVGCVGGSVEEQGKHRYSGYFEFAFNSRDGISDASNYFPAFFHFDRMMQSLSNVPPVLYHWELIPCTFVERGHPSGYSCAVTVNTHWRDSAAEARADWEMSLAYLAQLLGQIPPFGPDSIY